MIKVETKYNDESIKRFALLQMRILRPVYIIMSVVFAVCGLSFISVGMVGFGVFFLIVFGFGFFPMCYGLTLHSQNSANNFEPLLKANVVQVYEIDDDKFSMEGSSKYGFYEKNEINYVFVYKTFETKDSFFILLSKMKALVIPKDNMAAEDIVSVRKIFATKTNFKSFCK